MIPISIKYVIQNGGFAHVKNQALQAWRARARGAGRLKPKSEDDSSILGERLLVSEEEGSVEVHGILESVEPLSFLETAKLSLQFSLLWFVGNYFATACLEYTSVASVSILTSTSSVWTLIFCAVMKIESFSARKLIGVLASLSGVVLISLVDLTGDGNDDDRGNFPHKSQAQLAIGDAMAFFSAIVYGIYVVVMKMRIGNEDRVNMPLFFGLVGTFNLLLLWPVFPILHYTGIEPVSRLRWAHKQVERLTDCSLNCRPMVKSGPLFWYSSPTNNCCVLESDSSAAQLTLLLGFRYLLGIRHAPHNSARRHCGFVIEYSGVAGRTDGSVRSILELRVLGWCGDSTDLVHFHHSRKSRG